MLRPLIITFVFLCASCSWQEHEARAKAINDHINQNISAGDSREEIEKFLNYEGWVYSYDEVLKTYFARDPADNSNFVGYMIKIYLDEEERFQWSIVEIWTNTL